MKPSDHLGYTPSQTNACEKLLVSLVRWSGPWRDTLYLVGGLVPRYLLDQQEHVGTVDVDLMLDLDQLEDTEAYRTLEQNLKRMGLKRSQNEDGQAQHFRWTTVEPDDFAAIDLLCPALKDQPGGSIQPLGVVGQKRLSALRIPGGHLVFQDYEERVIQAELIGERGTAEVKVRVAGISSFIVLKALAYEERGERKDAYDLVFCLLNFQTGPEEAGKVFAAKMAELEHEPLFPKAVGILRSRFASDERIAGDRKDGPHSYADFIAPGDPEGSARARQNAVAAVELFLAQLG
ncbi:MAG: nucleotidyl transferase AbiEii/AbiGii toxin family protein [Candidatus Eremiobacteraeota bacterium]|nr:nucleotidyl transferase AbiEii/AbiGii toxin family protein [Candidatus Eremiobacteraeota bacterium]